MQRLCSNSAAIAKRSRSDCTAIAKRFRSVCAPFAQYCVVITKRLRSVCASIALRFRSDFPAIPLRFLSDSAAIPQRFCSLLYRFAFRFAFRFSLHSPLCATLIHPSSSHHITSHRISSQNLLFPITSSPQLQVVLQPRSLLFFSEDLYTHYMHGIESSATATTNAYANAETDSKATQRVGDHGPCLNKHLVGMKDGDSVSRGVRTSLTMRRVISPTT
jgi:hypothetical protein